VTWVPTSTSTHLAYSFLPSALETRHPGRIPFACYHMLRYKEIYKKMIFGRTEKSTFSDSVYRWGYTPWSLLFQQTNKYYLVATEDPRADGRGVIEAYPQIEDPGRFDIDEGISSSCTTRRVDTIGPAHRDIDVNDREIKIYYISIRYAGSCKRVTDLQIS
jgi:hypothetical protein